MKHPVGVRAFFASGPLLAALILAGCGGGGGGTSPVSDRTGRLSLAIEWPEPTRLIPNATKSIRVVISKGASQVSQVVIKRPAPPEGNSISQSFDLDADDANEYTIVASAMPTENGSGTPLATGSDTFPIFAGQESKFAVTMNSEVKKAAFYVKVNGDTERKFVVEPGQKAPNLGVKAGDTVEVRATATNEADVDLLVLSSLSSELSLVGGSGLTTMPKPASHATRKVFVANATSDIRFQYSEQNQAVNLTFDLPIVATPPTFVASGMASVGGVEGLRDVTAVGTQRVAVRRATGVGFVGDIPASLPATISTGLNFTSANSTGVAVDGRFLLSLPDGRLRLLDSPNTPVNSLSDARDVLSVAGTPYVLKGDRVQILNGTTFGLDRSVTVNALGLGVLRDLDTAIAPHGEAFAYVDGMDRRLKLASREGGTLTPVNGFASVDADNFADISASGRYIYLLRNGRISVLSVGGAVLQALDLPSVAGRTYRRISVSGSTMLVGFDSTSMTPNQEGALRYTVH